MPALVDPAALNITYRELACADQAGELRFPGMATQFAASSCTPAFAASGLIGGGPVGD